MICLLNIAFPIAKCHVSRGIRMTASMIVGSRKGNHMESSSNGPRFQIGISWWIARILPHYRSSDLQKPRAQPGLRDRWWIAPSCRADHSRCAAVMAYAGWGLYIMTLGLALGLGEMFNRENLRAMFHWYWCVFGMKVVESGEIPFAENGKGNSFWYNSLRFHVHMRKTQWIFVNIYIYIFTI